MSAGNSKIKYFYLVMVVVIALAIGYQVGLSDRGGAADSWPLRFLDIGRERAPRSANWNLLWDAIDKINDKYVDRPADQVKLLYGAVSGAVAGLDDPYSVFLPPKEAKEFADDLKGNFEGIGAEIAIKNQRLTVVTPLPGSPAEKAGLKSGDFIYKVDETETTDLTIEEAVGKIRGPAGSKVKLSVLHRGATAPVDISIVRQKIEIKSVTAEIREARGKKLGILKMRRFGEETTGEVSAALDKFLLQNVQGIILDLRNNPGGYLDAAVEVAGNWVREGEVVVVQRYGNGKEDDVYKSEGSPKVSGVPTIVLINGGSASSSEILAGALRDHGLAKLVGEKSFGKGSIQELIDLAEGAELKLTIAKWLTPKGHDLNKEGLDPDVKVELTDEDFEADRDPQLDRALEILAP